jgi:hypothetical protein
LQKLSNPLSIRHEWPAHRRLLFGKAMIWSEARESAILLACRLADPKRKLMNNDWNAIGKQRMI